MEEIHPENPENSLQEKSCFLDIYERIENGNIATLHDIKELNDCYSLGLDLESKTIVKPGVPLTKNLMIIYAVNGVIYIEYIDSRYEGGDKVVKITITENEAKQVVYNGLEKNLILFENTFRKQSEQEIVMSQQFYKLLEIIKNNENEIKYVDNDGFQVSIKTKKINGRYDSDYKIENIGTGGRGIEILRTKNLKERKPEEIDSEQKSYCLIRRNDGSFFIQESKKLGLPKSRIIKNTEIEDQINYVNSIIKEGYDNNDQERISELQKNL